MSVKRRAGCTSASDTRNAMLRGRPPGAERRELESRLPPVEARERAYEERMRRAFPFHPELFDRLYEDWNAAIPNGNLAGSGFLEETMSLR